MLPELYDDDQVVDLNEYDARVYDADGVVDDLALRQLMIEDAKADREIDRVKRTRDAVKASYDDRIASLQARKDRVRSMLQAYLERQPEGAKVRFEDVGTAYLQKGDPKVEIADRDAVKEALGAMFTKEVFDETAAKAYALQEAIEGRPIPDGINIVPGGPQLRIRKS